jgi:hypothetical protein
VRKRLTDDDKYEVSDDEVEEEERWDIEERESLGPLAPPPPCVLHPRAAVGGCSCGDNDRSNTGLFSLFRKGLGCVHSSVLLRIRRMFEGDLVVTWPLARCTRGLCNYPFLSVSPKSTTTEVRRERPGRAESPTHGLFTACRHRSPSLRMPPLQPPHMQMSHFLKDIPQQSPVEFHPDVKLR